MTASSLYPELEPLRQQLESEVLKKQLSVIPQLANAGDPGLEILMSFLQENRDQDPKPAIGSAYIALFQIKTPEILDFLKAYFPHGVVSLQSDREIDYQPLQDLLIQQDFQQGDRLTLEKLCELAGEQAMNRQWLYFSEVDRFPKTDLQTINALWLAYSEGKFGFSVQRELWLAQGKNFNKLWDKIGWKKENNWTRYPNGFIWDLSAPRGHLPLSNQLRGVQPFASLLNHPAWVK
ncbi:MAG: GUN4 N-terminal ARM-like repeat domain-containing protein [Cyanobacteria bacterium SBLK]|nr:GUN4 N-terminal ARM-like repeat domain-containing protein [Cyanobacteria bacterium SBLK]